jgi:hypothetical protein
MGTIVKLYREWQLSGDLEFLKRHWTRAKKGLEFAWTQWDGIETVSWRSQHNTYDIEFHDPNPMMGAICLRLSSAPPRWRGRWATALGPTDLYRRGRGSRLRDLERRFTYSLRRARRKYQWGGLPAISPRPVDGPRREEGHVLPRAREERDPPSTVQLQGKFRPMRTPADFRPRRRAGFSCSWPRARALLPFVCSDEVWTESVSGGAHHLRGLRRRRGSHRASGEEPLRRRAPQSLEQWNAETTTRERSRAGRCSRSIGFTTPPEKSRLLPGGCEFVSFWSVGEPGYGCTNRNGAVPRSPRPEASSRKRD